MMMALPKIFSMSSTIVEPSPIEISRPQIFFRRLKKHPALPWFILILLTLIWGSSFIQIKKAMLVFSPYQLASMRVTTAFLFFATFGWLFFKKIPRNRLIHLFCAGILGAVAPNFLFPLAQQGVSSSLTGVLNGLTPMFTWLIGLWFFGQKTTRNQLIGLGLGLLGALSLTLIGANGKLNFNFYAIFILLAALGNGIYLNLIKKYLSHLPSVQVTAVSILLAAPIVMVFLGGMEIPETYQAKTGSFWALMSIIFLGVVSTALSSIIFNYLLQIASPIFVSTVTYLIPIVAIMWGLLDGESISLAQYLGIVAIIMGVYVLNKK
jgi:drug/metabolite transporter (DMT)-like permease